MAPEAITHAFKIDHKTWTVEEISTATIPNPSDALPVGHLQLHPGPFVTADVNSFLSNASQSGHSDSMVHALMSCPGEDYLRTFDIKDGCSSPHSRIVPSWRRMYLTQPPVQQVSFFVSHSSDTDYCPQRKLVEKSDGVMLGDVVDVIRQRKVARQRIEKQAIEHIHPTTLFLKEMRVAFYEREKDSFRRFAEYMRSRTAQETPLDDLSRSHREMTNLEKEWDDMQRK